jgi:metal-responsive CopG/Arc/MetJ family transcriptional regulator
MCQGMNTMPRLKKPTSLALDPELLERLEAWIAKQEFPPSKTVVFETALREFLDKREGSKKR